MTTTIFDNIPADWYQQPLTDNPAVNAVIALSLRYPTYWTIGYSGFSSALDILEARTNANQRLLSGKKEQEKEFILCCEIYKKICRSYHGGSWNATLSAVQALIVYEHSDHYLDMPIDELRTWIRLSKDPAATLIESVRKPMALSLSRIKVLNNG